MTSLVMSNEIVLILKSSSLSQSHFTCTGCTTVTSSSRTLNLFSWFRESNYLSFSVHITSENSILTFFLRES